MKTVFLGGTCGNNLWRPIAINFLLERGVKHEQIFNPVVSNWDEEAQRREEKAKATSSYLLFYLASPKQEGNPLSAYSMVEATMSLYDKPTRTVVIFDHSEITLTHTYKASKQTENVLRTRFPNDNIFSDISGLNWLADNLTKK